MSENSSSFIKGDRPIWAVLILLSIISILIVYSSTSLLSYGKQGGNTEYYLIKQVLIICLGIGVTFFVSRVKPGFFIKISPILLLLSGLLLGYTLVFGVDINDAKRWVNLPFIGFTIQSSDVAKIALIIHVARIITKRQEVIKDLKSAFLPLMAPIVLFCLLIALADLSTALIIFVSCLGMLFAGRVSLKHLGFLFILGLLIFGILIYVGQFFPDFFRAETWINRLTEFWGDGKPNIQVEKSKIAIATGEFFGLGPGHSIQRNFLPAPYSDFVYATIIEEYGLFGGFLVLFIYMFLFYRGLVIITKSPKTFSAILVFGLSFNLVIQALANMAVSVNLVPVTGLTLPLISMGGSSLIFTFISIGIILSVSNNINVKASAEKVKSK